MSRQSTISAMRLTHSVYAWLTIVKSVAIHHFKFIDDFLIDRAAFLTPSPLECCQPNPPAPSLTPLALVSRRDRENTKSRIARIHFARSGFFLLSLFALPCSQATADTITVATASNFLNTLKALQQPFAKQSGHKLIIVAGSSGAIATQIINSAPYDVFLSADHARPNQLVEKGVGDQASLFTYAYGKLTLWSANKSLITDGDGPLALKQANFRHIAMANPALAPYGLASIETLRSINLYFNLSEKIIHGENIAQTFAMMATGAAPIGFAARSQVTRKPWKSTGSFWHVPTNLHQPIKQSAVIVTHSKNKPAARMFMQFLKSAPAIKIIKSFGYDAK